MSTYVVVKIDDEYVTELQSHDRGHKTKGMALKEANFLNNEEWTYIAPLGKGTNKLGTSQAQDEERETANEKVKRSWKLKKK
jgi:hypothetical protein